jgi:hypothetical protein
VRLPARTDSVAKAVRGGDRNGEPSGAGGEERGERRGKDAPASSSSARSASRAASCYPAGSYDEESVAAVEEAGDRLAITTEPGLASPQDDPLTLPRIRVQGSDGRDGLARKLTDAGA